jgi:hypothetical protein
MSGLRGRQQGISVLGLLFGFVLVAFIAVVMMRIVPAYISYWTVKSAMDSIARSAEPIVGGKPTIMSMINRRLEINDVSGIDPKAFQIQKGEHGAYDVEVAYERREHLFGNIDVVLVFNHAVEVKAE